MSPLPISSHTTDLSAGPQPRQSVMMIDPYVPGKSKATGQGPVFKLSSNETPLGPSPHAVAAFRAAADHLFLYPEGTSTRLRTAVGKKFGLDPARIICGAGSDELLSLLAYAFMGEGDEGLYSAHGFLVYKIAILAAGGVPVVAPETHLTADVDALLDRVTSRTKVVFLANPNNPTGTALSGNDLKRLHAGLPSHVLLVLDGAYAEYTAGQEQAALDLASAHANVAVTRTFSKIYGLAAARLGWMTAHSAIIDAVNRIRGPFNVGTPTLEAGIAALEDEKHLEAAIAHNIHWRSWLTEAIHRIGLEVTPSEANFLLIHFPLDRGRTAEDADAFLSSRGLILRRVSAYGLPNALRLTVGSEEACQNVVTALNAFMKAV